MLFQTVGTPLTDYTLL